ncbi:unnamed protein product [Candidula unifasciata]|uniref:Uncharacterized protein n=1 Tax=Candidula unifasciata TaxID=100452 RepID=A0A8S3ZR86_9EUPU|nr:unnamed protein product [Candidula unifasciata]
METADKCPPINTSRLSPVSQRFGKICMAVSECGQVTLEVKSRVGKSCDSNQFEKTKKFIRISSDGMQIEVYKSVEGAPSIHGCPTSSPSGQVYTYPDMPERLWKKYHNAYKFVEVIKSVTPKVTLLTDRARCKLMENSPSPNFQACFHNGVTLLFSKMKVTLTENDGSSLSFHEDLASSHVSQETLALLEYSLQCREQCLKIENTVNGLQSRNSHQGLFPIVIGMSTLQHRNNVNMGTNVCKQAAVAEKSPEQINKNVSVFHYNYECPRLQGNLYPPSDKSYFDANVPAPCAFSSAQNISQGLNHQSAWSAKETQDWLIGNSSSFYNSSNSISSCSCSMNHAAISSPLKSTMAEGFQSHNSSNISTDPSLDVKPTFLVNSTNCEDHLPYWQSMPGHETNTGLINKFQAECKIAENCNDSHLLFENGCSAQDQATFSLSCQTCFCNNTDFQPGQLTCLTNMPDSHIGLFQNPFSTPQKSQMLCDSFRYPCSGEDMKCRHKTPVSYDFKVHERQLRDVKRNLFSEKISEESLPVPTTSCNILMHGMLNFSDCSCSTNLVYQHSEIQNYTQSNSLDSVPLQIGMVLENSSQVMTPQLTPGKTSRFTETAMRYSPVSHKPPAYSRLESVAPTSCSDTSSEYNRTQSIDLSVSFSEDASSAENSNIINDHSTAFERSLIHRHFNGPSPENNNSPKKSTPLRKIASLSPHKIRNIQMISAEEYVEKMPDDSSLFQHQAGPVKSNRSSSSDSDESSMSNYQTISSVNDLSTLNKPAFKSHPSMPLYKDFPSLSPSSESWNGQDLPLSRHMRRSLDVSSDGCSSGPPSSTCDVLCQVFVPYVGWASLYATGTVWVLYNDGTQLGVKSTEATVIYVGQDGSRARYNKTDVIPEIVKIKLEKLPKVIDLIKKSQETGFSGVQLWQS